MNERSAVAGLLSGRLRPRDVRGVDARAFNDPILGWLFAIAVSCRELGAIPTTQRILSVLTMEEIDAAGALELIDALRKEG